VSLALFALNRQGPCRFLNASDHFGVNKKRAHPRNTAFLPAINICTGSKQRLAQLRKYRLAIEPIAAGYVLSRLPRPARSIAPSYRN
jgi:hypothetical protein